MGSRYSAALCRGLIEAATRSPQSRGGHRIPRLYAAASLKRDGVGDLYERMQEYSAALCRGLIEARCGVFQLREGGGVFRGFMPRPH